MHPWGGVRNWRQNLWYVILLWLPCPHHQNSIPWSWCCYWATGARHPINPPEYLHHTNHGSKAYQAWSCWCTRKEDVARDSESPKCMSCRPVRRPPRNMLQQRTETAKLVPARSLLYLVQKVILSTAQIPPQVLELQVHTRNVEPQNEKDSERSPFQKKCLVSHQAQEISMIHCSY